jgi:hypothetical protein
MRYCTNINSGVASKAAPKKHSLRIFCSSNGPPTLGSKSTMEPLRKWGRALDSEPKAASGSREIEPGRPGEVEFVVMFTTAQLWLDPGQGQLATGLAGTGSLSASASGPPVSPNRTILESRDSEPPNTGNRRRVLGGERAPRDCRLGRRRWVPLKLGRLARGRGWPRGWWCETTCWWCGPLPWHAQRECEPPRPDQGQRRLSVRACHPNTNLHRR